MSIVSVNEITEQRVGSLTSDGLVLARVYRVETNAASDGPGLVIYAAGIPEEGDPHNEVAVATMRRKTVAVDQNSRLFWLVTCRYETPSARNPIQIVRSDDPTDDPPKIQFTTLSTTEQLDRAYTLDDEGPDVYSTTDPQTNPTKAVQNSALQPFDPSLGIDVTNLQIHITRNESDFVGNVVRLFVNTINDRAIVIAGVSVAPISARMATINGSERRDSQDRTYWEVQYVIALREKTWMVKILDQGYYTWDGSVLHKIIVDGTDITEPRRLDGAGAILVAPPASVNLDNMAYFPKNWGSLNLPTQLVES